MTNNFVHYFNFTGKSLYKVFFLCSLVFLTVLFSCPNPTPGKNGGGDNTSFECSEFVGTAPVKNDEGIYEIGSLQEIIYLSKNAVDAGDDEPSLGDSYILTSDIVFPDISTCAGKEYTPIGSMKKPFTGVFDGAGYSISGLEISSISSYVGFFGYLYGNVVIRNLTLKDVSITGKAVAGALAGGVVGRFGDSGTIENVRIEGGTLSITGTETITKDSVQETGAYAGGLIGYSESTVVRNIFTNIDIGALGDYVGGIVGYQKGSITASEAQGKTSGKSYIGGLVGYITAADNYDGTVKVYTLSDSSATGKVIGTGSSVGGLVGSAKVKISNSFAKTGSVKGLNTVGGLVGNAEAGITDSYAEGSVNGREDVGGLAGLVVEVAVNGYATGVVTGSGNNIGGLVGRILGQQRITVRGYATGDVNGIAYVGGLVGKTGELSTSAISGYAEGNVSGTGDYVGGLVGKANGDTTGYATGDVSGQSNTGGLVGISNNGTLSGYATGDVTGFGENIGGLVGSITGNSSGFATGNVYGGIKFDSTNAITGVQAAKNVGGYAGITTGDGTKGYATGNVYGSSNVGGLVGKNDRAGLFGYARGNVISTLTPDDTTSYETSFSQLVGISIDVNGNEIGGAYEFLYYSSKQDSDATVNLNKNESTLYQLKADDFSLLAYASDDTVAGRSSNVVGVSTSATDANDGDGNTNWAQLPDAEWTKAANTWPAFILSKFYTDGDTSKDILDIFANYSAASQPTAP